MLKNELKYPIAGLFIWLVAMSVVSMGVDHQQHNPSTKTFQLRNH